MANGRTEQVKPGEHPAERSAEGSKLAAKNLNATELLAKGGAHLAANEKRQDAAGNKALAAFGQVKFTDSGKDKSLTVVQEKKVDSKLAGVPAQSDADDGSDDGSRKTAKHAEKHEATHQTHTVKPGESLSKIAKEHLGAHASQQDIQREVNAIAKLNHIANPDLIRPGQHLKLPEHKPEHIDKDTYTVKRGDSLSKIAKEHLGPHASPADVQHEVSAIAKLNHIANPDLIKSGQHLKLPEHTHEQSKTSTADASAKVSTDVPTAATTAASELKGLAAAAGKANVPQEAKPLQNPGIPTDTIASATAGTDDVLKNPGMPAEAIANAAAGAVDLLKNPAMPVDTNMGMPNDLKNMAGAASAQAIDLLKKPGIPADVLATATASDRFNDMVNAAARGNDGAVQGQTRGEIQHPVEAHPKPETQHPDDRHENYKVQPGDSLWKIARKHLGEQAKVTDIWNYIHKTAELNGIKNERLIASGATLKLPGDNDLPGAKSGDGKPVVTQKPDATVRQKPDATVPQKPDATVPQKPDATVPQKPDATVPQKPDATVPQKPDATVPQKPDATVPQKPDATVPQKPDATVAQKPDATVAQKPDATVTHKPDATTIAKDDSGKVARDKVADQAVNTPEQQLQTQKDHLDALLDAQTKNHRMDAAQEGRIKDNMAAFEKQSKNMEDTYSKQIHYDNPNMPPEQVAKLAHDRAQKEVSDTYKQVSELFEKQSTVPGMTDQRQHELAEQILYNAGHAKELDQGQHNSCELMSGEKRTYMRSPAEAARLVKDAALTGHYVTTHSKLDVAIDTNSLMPHGDANNPIQDNQRDYASQIYQVVSANVYYKAENIPLQYQQGDSVAQPSYNPNGQPIPPFHDTGERILNLTTGQYLTDNNKGMVTLQDVPGAASTDHALTVMDAEINYKPNETPRSNFCFGGPRQDDNTQASYSPEEMANNMKAALDRGDGPLVLEIKTANPPIGQNPGGGHAITIDSYTPAQYPGELPMFNLDNSWGKANDHPYDSVYNLYRLTGDPGQQMPGIANDGGLSELTNDAQQIEQLRSMHMHGQLNDSAYQDALRQQATAIRIQLQSYGQTAADAQAMATLNAEVTRALNGLPPAMRAYVLDPNPNANVNDNH